MCLLMLEETIVSAFHPPSMSYTVPLFSRVSPKIFLLRDMGEYLSLASSGRTESTDREESVAELATKILHDKHSVNIVLTLENFLNTPCLSFLIF